MALLPDTWNRGLRMRREYRERFPRHRFQRKPLGSDMHHGTWVTHVPWCMSGSLNRGGGGKRPRHSRRMRNSQFYVSGKRPMQCIRFNPNADMKMKCVEIYAFCTYHANSNEFWFSELVFFRQHKGRKTYTGRNICHMINSSRPCDAYIHRGTRPSFVQIMFWLPFGTKPLSEPMLVNYKLDYQEQIVVKFPSR